MHESLKMQEGSPPRFSFPDLLLLPSAHHISACCSELSSSTSTPFVSAPSSPSRTFQAFYFSAPTSPSWPPRSLQKQQGSDVPYWPLPSSPQSSRPQSPPHQSSLAGHSYSDSIHTWAHPTVHLHSSASVESDTIRSHTSSPLPTEHLAGSSPWSHQKSPEFIQHERASSWVPQPLQTEHHRSSPFPHRTHQTENEKSPNWTQPSLSSATTSSTSCLYKSLHTHPQGRSPSLAQQLSLQKGLQTEHALGAQTSPQVKDRHAANSLKSISTESANSKSLKRLQVEDIDASYSRKSFYASAVPFSWEEKPGTPKARSITSEASNGEDDSPSNLLSGSSEFEFSARFSELEDPPMSPTPISSAFNSFKHHYGYGSPSPSQTYLSYTSPDTQSETANEGQVWPLRPPPRLDTARLQKEPIKDEESECKRSCGLLASLSAPQSPRSPRIFDLRGALCGISGRVEAVFDPFLTAMEKSMAKNGGDEEMRKSPKKKMNHHRRTQSLSPLRVFHWDDHSVKSNSSSNGSSCMDEVKNKHPIQREINARHSAGTPKASKRWSFKGFLHRKSVSGAESARNSTSASLRSSGRESCSSLGMGEGPMDVSCVDDARIRGANSPMNYNNSSMLASNMPSTPSSILSPSSSNSSSKGKHDTIKGNKGPYALHYSAKRAHAEELRKKTFLPYKQGLLGCLGLSSKSYRALVAVSKPLQSVS